MTDKEIIKASELVEKLRSAYNDYYDLKKSMPYDIDTTLLHSALCLENCVKEINRQQAEIEQYKARICNDTEYTERIEVENRLLQTEIERLNSDLRIWKDIAHRETGYVEIARAEAIKECLEWVLSLFNENEFYVTIAKCTIMNKLKEMVGEQG